MKPIQSAQIQVNTNLEALKQVLAWFNQFDHATVPQPVWLQCQLALAEGFTNAVRHAHRNSPPETPIDVEVNLSGKSIEIRIWDCGPAYDLESDLASLTSEMDRESAGGRGLKLMKKMANTLHYSRTADHRNCLLFVKHYL